MSEDLSTFYVEYQFAKISGGPVLKRTVNALPAAAPAPAAGPTLLSAAANFSYVVTEDGGDFELDGAQCWYCWCSRYIFYFDCLTLVRSSL